MKDLSVQGKLSHGVNEGAGRRDLRLVFAVFANRFDRAAFEGFHAQVDVFLRGRLLMDVGVAAVVVAREKVGRGFAAQVAVNALLVYVKLTGHVLGPFVSNISHNAQNYWIALSIVKTYLTVKWP